MRRNLCTVIAAAVFCAIILAAGPALAQDTTATSCRTPTRPPSAASCPTPWTPPWITIRRPDQPGGVHLLALLDPCSADSDGDGPDDWVEVFYGSNPLANLIFPQSWAEGVPSGSALG